MDNSEADADDIELGARSPEEVDRTERALGTRPTTLCPRRTAGLMPCSVFAGLRRLHTRPRSGNGERPSTGRLDPTDPPHDMEQVAERIRADTERSVGRMSVADIGWFRLRARMPVDQTRGLIVPLAG